MFFDYLKEVEGLDAIIRPYGFLVYKINNNEFFVAHFYVPKEKRGAGYGKTLYEEAKKKAKKKGCTLMSCNLHYGDNGVANNYEMYKSVGFMLANKTKYAITMVKEL